jgi:hypothetical protein
MDMKSKLSRKTLTIASGLLAASSVAQASQAVTKEEIRKESSNAQQILNQIRRFGDLLRDNVTFRLQYLANPEQVLLEQGFSKLVRNEILREDGFFQSADGSSPFMCSLTCACSGCCVTSISRGGGNDGGGGGSGGGSGGDPSIL